ncbi:hypothetical protein I79_020062 [Cricetulus griseus]|uniref:Uncharacterized protein n=1 Tax=Cricetulus griseus TaxID=10029 RepID=G3I928_CRIGR|nr:hypothetical protein I79_020062 [Cricetulus griseus]
MTVRALSLYFCTDHEVSCSFRNPRDLLLMMQRENSSSIFLTPLALYICSAFPDPSKKKNEKKKERRPLLLHLPQTCLTDRSWV